ncbi:Nucleolar complex-associated protein 3 [Golovinomyces cichoracearum]|uniref:Nucleolar complex-associated protein 3 n=1 Tax=Golovinomyces cichoracearum TaxID=62708 RepID=A0A420IXN8_9PEZI|nr:Nucleolar complex-associated protein 3 [Golovinomyces cichoracearum]
MKRSVVTKKRKLLDRFKEDNNLFSPIAGIITEGNTVIQASHWNLEQDYETKPRKSRKAEKENKRLPIKTAEGLVQQIPGLDELSEEDESEQELLNVDRSKTEDETLVTKAQVPLKEEILGAQEELAKTALFLRDNDPEEHLGAFKTLAQIGQSPHPQIKKLALLTQLAVYKDIIPGYRIRPISEEDRTTKVSKEVKKLRAYEQALVAGYQKYVTELSKLADSPIEGDKKPSLASVAISCACTLLISVPHFNFRGELVKILVGKLSSKKIDADFVKCRETIEKLFQEDEEGGNSLDVVTHLAKMMKQKGYRVDESVMNLFLHLRLLIEFSSKGSTNHIDRTKKVEFKGNKLKDKKVFRTKKEKKLMRERKVVEQEMKAADAVVSHEERDRIQAETLKQVFLIYFRVLKQKSSNLTGAVLEGLASYAHLINQDFFGDLLEALKDLIGHKKLTADMEIDELDGIEVRRNMTREALLCIITAFVLLEGQEAAKAKGSLNLDLNFFVTHLYASLYTLSLDPNIELNSKSLHISDPKEHVWLPSTTSKINFQTTTVLLLRSISSILLPPLAARAVPPLRIAAFTKQLMTSCLQLPEKSCISIVTLIGKITKFHEKKIASLWNTEERLGDGIFDALNTELEGSNPFAATVWEGELLRKHFSPAVRNGVKLIEKNVIGLR